MPRCGSCGFHHVHHPVKQLVSALLPPAELSLVLQVLHAQMAGATAAIVYNNAADGFEKMTLDSSYSGPALTLPSVFIPASYAQPLLAALLAGFQLTVRFRNLVLPSNRWESLAYFSSVGPTPDGRLKPDVTAPGTTISPESDG